MHPEIKKLLQLQTLETEIRQYAERIELLPKQLQALESKLQASLQAQIANKDQLAKLAGEKKKLEGAIQDLEQKSSKYKGQLIEVKTNEQYRALLSEIEFNTVEIRKIEDEILVKMEWEEKLRAEGQQLERQLQQEKAVVESEKKSAQAEVEKDKALVAELELKRKALIATIAGELYDRYLHIASFRKGVALAQASQETCQACNVRIRPQVFSEVMSSEIIHTCDSCGRILYWKPDVPYEVTQ